MNARAGQNQAEDTSNDRRASSFAAEVPLDDKAADLGLDIRRSVRAELRDIKELLDARYITSGHYPPKAEMEAFNRWRSVSRSLNLHVGEELFLGPTLALRSGDELNQLSDAIADAHHLRWVTPADAESLKLIDRRRAEGLSLSTSERESLQHIRYQIHERKIGKGCLSEAESALLTELCTRFVQPSLQSLGLKWIAVQRGDEQVLEPSPLEGRYSTTSLRRLPSPYFSARMRMLHPERSESEREAHQIFSAAREAAQLREHGYHERSNAAWDSIIADLAERFPPSAKSKAS